MQGPFYHVHLLPLYFFALPPKSGTVGRLPRLWYDNHWETVLPIDPAFASMAASSLLSCSLLHPTPWGTKHAVLEQSCTQIEHTWRPCPLLPNPSKVLAFLPCPTCALLTPGWAAAYASLLLGPAHHHCQLSDIFPFCSTSALNQAWQLNCSMHRSDPLLWTQQQRVTTVKGKTCCPPDKTCPFISMNIFLCFYLLMHNYFFYYKI